MGLKIDVNDVLDVAGKAAGKAHDFLVSHTVSATATSFALSYGSDVLTFSGTGLTYLMGVPVGGVITGITDVHDGAVRFDASGFSLNVSEVLDLIASKPSPSAIAAALPADSVVQGGADDDVLSVDDGPGGHELRGLDGDDSVSGGSGHDLINGNRGSDTVDGGSGGDDTLSGGQGNDLIRGHHGHGSFNGNIGDDTVQAGDTGDVLHGGQGNDVLLGGAGNDQLFGDRGDDTVTGGQGADLFHFAPVGGHDTITDFNAEEGDRLQIDHSEHWTVSDTADGTVVTLQGGEAITLSGVHATSLPTDWIFHD
jgi:Ca2+-binding RTX toxin-like protein